VRIAAVDIGTNSMRLLIADAVEGRLVEGERHSRVTRLGEGVDRDRRFAEEPMRRTLEALAWYGERMRAERVERARAIATSATRDAGNREEFLDRAGAALGTRPDVIDGEEEAALSFAGATAGITAAGSVAVVDIGGGSTEFVYGADRPEYARSIDIGSVRLTERAIPDRPAPPEQVTAAQQMVATAFAEVQLPGRAQHAIGVAGTITSLAAMALGLAEHDRAAVHGSTLGTTDIDLLIGRLAGLTVEGTIAAFPALDPMRAPVILGGAIVAAGVLHHLGVDGFAVSESDILDGVAMALAG
jgi:exopolyphosphatase/guanosine-5'-triphosphate,3'-diphosphate pyrophosphatase